VLDLNVIRSRLDFIDENVTYLAKIAELKFESFSSDPDKTRSTRYALQVCIEACLDIGQHIIAGLGLGRPANYKDVFTTLSNKDILSADFAKKIIPMARFRNRLVHLYWEVDNEKMYEIIQNDLGDFAEFTKQITDFTDEYEKTNNVEK
jgi:uncharacterized protein YutE (UPF0331/DUF86 family)